MNQRHSEETIGVSVGIYVSVEVQRLDDVEGHQMNRRYEFMHLLANGASLDALDYLYPPQSPI
jgi:hypothetical protein